MHRNVDQDESNPRREIDCWNSNRIYRRSQALFTSAGLIVRSIQGLDLAPILHKLPRGFPSCQLWLLRFVCLVVCVFFMYGYAIITATLSYTPYPDNYRIYTIFFTQKRRIIQLQSFITSIQNIQPSSQSFQLNFKLDQNNVQE